MYPGVRPIICHASWPIASTSFDRLLSAITVGSLRMIPWPREYTSVFAVPRSIARSLASAPTSCSRRPVGVERLAAGGEVVDAGVEPLGVAVAQQHDGDADDDHAEGEREELHVSPGPRRRGNARSWRRVPSRHHPRDAPA